MLDPPEEGGGSRPKGRQQNKGGRGSGSGRSSRSRGSRRIGGSVGSEIRRSETEEREGGTPSDDREEREQDILERMNAIRGAPDEESAMKTAG